MKKNMPGTAMAFAGVIDAMITMISSRTVLLKRQAWLKKEKTA